MLGSVLGALFYIPLGRTMTQSLHPTETITVILNGSLTLPLAPENISTVPLYHIHKNLWDTVVSTEGLRA